MILPEYKALFIHVPKAAGQSIEDFLLESLGKNRDEHGAGYLLKKAEKDFKGPKRLAHLTFQDYGKYNFLNQEALKDWFSFAFVRNPWSRMLSFYKFEGFSSVVSFETYITEYLPKYFEEEKWFFRPQVEFVYSEDDTLLVDFLGRLESINEDFQSVAERINVPFEKLPRNNHSLENGLFSKKSINLYRKHPDIFKRLNARSKNIKNYKDAYTDKSKAVVAQLFERDIDLLKYTF